MVSVQAVSGVRPCTAGASLLASAPPPLELPLPAPPLLELEQAAIPPAAPVDASVITHKARIVLLVTFGSSSWGTLDCNAHAPRGRRRITLDSAHRGMFVCFFGGLLS